MDGQSHSLFMMIFIISVHKLHDELDLNISFDFEIIKKDAHLQGNKVHIA